MRKTWIRCEEMKQKLKAQCLGFARDGVGMENLIAKRRYKEAFDRIIKELEDDPDSKEELKELFSFVLETYW